MDFIVICSGYTCQCFRSPAISVEGACFVEVLQASLA